MVCRSCVANLDYAEVPDSAAKSASLYPRKAETELWKVSVKAGSAPRKVGISSQAGEAPML